MSTPEMEIVNSAEYDLWNDPDICNDPGCIIDGQGDPDPFIVEFPQVFTT